MPRCKLCREPTTQRFALTYACSIDHALEYAKRKAERNRAKAEREERRKHREQREKVRPLSWYRNTAQAACNAYIRARDANKPCVSCGATESYQWDAGHFRPAGVNSAHRFNENNLARQCIVCNRHKSGNLASYRIELVRRIGEEAVRELENSNQVKKWAREELIEIREYYKAKFKQLKCST